MMPRAPARIRCALTAGICFWVGACVFAWPARAARCDDPPQSTPAAPGDATIPPAATVFTEPEPTLIATGLVFAEGPVLRDGTLYVCDLAGGTIYTIDPAKATKDKPAPLTVFREHADRPAGTAFDRDGNLLVTHFTGKVTRSDTEGTIITLAYACEGVPLSKCNDLAITPWGDVFFTDFGGGKAKEEQKVSKGLFALVREPDKHAHDAPAVDMSERRFMVVSLDTDYKAANGVCYDAPRNVLYVADYGANKVFAYDVAEGGPANKVSNRRLFADFDDAKAAGGGTPDGLKVDEQGRVFTTGPGGIWVLSSKGKRLAHVPIGGASNLCLGPIDPATGERDVYITAGKSVYRARAR